jgi:hypothetical protein
MSHIRLRPEKNCLNCGNYVADTFCSKCGQENKEPYESIWGMITHFVADILHWDGKFWRTIKTLFVQPGATSVDYIQGKRASYVLPIRLYLICSLIFGLAISSTFNDVEKEAKVQMAQASIKDAVSLIDTITPLTFPIIDSNGDIKGNLGYTSKGNYTKKETSGFDKKGTSTKINIPNGISISNIDSVLKIRKKLKGNAYSYRDYLYDYQLRLLTKRIEKSGDRIDLT